MKLKMKNMEKKGVSLKKLFEGMQNQMNAQLSVDRESINHCVSKGDALENAWIEWLRKYLPNRYSVDKAIVIDHKGNTSDQIDIVIYDNWYTPFVFVQNGFHYIPAEGVYAVFEVKPEIKDNIVYAGNKIESVRRLERKATTFIDGGIQRDPRALTKIVGGILCSTNSYATKDTIKNKLRELVGLKSIDMGCIADSGSFFVEYEMRNGIEKEIIRPGEQAYLDYYNWREFKDVTFSSPSHSFVTFYMQLSRYLQQAIGTVPAIDLSAYLEKIEEKIQDQI